MLPTEIEQLPFGEIRMGFDLDDSGLDPRDGDDFAQFLQGNIRQADRLAPTVVDEAFERSPGLDQRHPGIIDDLTALVPRVLLVAGPKGKRGMDEIAIDLVDLQPPPAGVKCGLDPLGTMVGVPQLRGDEEVLPPNRPRLNAACIASPTASSLR